MCLLCTDVAMNAALILMPMGVVWLAMSTMAPPIGMHGKCCQLHMCSWWNRTILTFTMCTCDHATGSCCPYSSWYVCVPVSAVVHTAIADVIMSHVSTTLRATRWLSRLPLLVWMNTIYHDTDLTYCCKVYTCVVSHRERYVLGCMLSHGWVWYSLMSASRLSVSSLYR